MLVTLAVGLLVLFGIVSPVFDAFVAPRAVENSMLPAGILLFVIAFAMYFGGMAASYRAPSRRRLHGVSVALILFAISPLVNFVSGREPLPQFETIGGVVLTLIALVVSVVAAYVGSLRGASLYAYNEAHNKKRRARRDGEQKESG